MVPGSISNLKTVGQVTMPVNIYIEDATAFGGLYEECQFNIQGMDMVSKDIGNIPYNTLDSMIPYDEAVYFVSIHPG